VAGPVQSAAPSGRVADRVAVGRKGGDRPGLASVAATCEVHPSVVWGKLKALADGARLANRALWRRAA